MRIGADGLVAGARYLSSPNCDPRPAGQAVTLLVVHSISLPPGQYGGEQIERLFTNRLDPMEHPYFTEVAGLRVSAHLLLRRNGNAIQFVPLHMRAWHAGESTWRGQARCNDFSVGIELEGGGGEVAGLLMTPFERTLRPLAQRLGRVPIAGSTATVAGLRGEL